MVDSEMSEYSENAFKSTHCPTCKQKLPSDQIIRTKPSPAESSANNEELVREPSTEEIVRVPSKSPISSMSSMGVIGNVPAPIPPRGGILARSPSTQVTLDKLQENLRRNVERYMNEALNTHNISRVVRELLSVHNIGQRLFAKYVLGLSQGTVSELLSKPKMWDKLTEKGRDSYRKMHAWAADENCIYLLKSMVPRKGKNS